MRSALEIVMNINEASKIDNDEVRKHEVHDLTSELLRNYNKVERERVNAESTIEVLKDLFSDINSARKDIVK